jgi:hypothetical protein
MRLTCIAKEILIQVIQHYRDPGRPTGGVKLLERHYEGGFLQSQKFVLIIHARLVSHTL